MFGAKLTLIVLTSQRLARIDLAGPRRQLRVERVLSCPASASSELASAVAIAYRLGELQHHPGALPKLQRGGSRSIIVLSDDIWNDSITLPLDVTVLLQPAEIQQALAIEAENFSGISAFNSRFVIRQLLDTPSNLLDRSTNSMTSTTWWVAQLAATDLASMSMSAQACGVKLLGATHLRAPWRTSPNALPDNDQATPLADDDNAAWLEFARHWAQCLSHDGLDLLIRPEATDLRKQRMGWIQTTAALATALACAGVYQVRNSQIRSAETEIKELQKTLAEYESVAEQHQLAQNKLQQAKSQLLHSQLAPAEDNRTKLVVTKPTPSVSVSNADWVAIFDALTRHTPEDCWIESWHSTDGHPVLAGRAVTAQAIHELASRLEQSLSDSYWQVLPPVIHTDDSTLLKFELPIIEQPSRGAEPPVTLPPPRSTAVEANSVWLAYGSRSGAQP